MKLIINSTLAFLVSGIFIACQSNVIHESHAKDDSETYFELNLRCTFEGSETGQGESAYAVRIQKMSTVSPYSVVVEAPVNIDGVSTTVHHYYLNLIDQNEELPGIQLSFEDGTFDLDGLDGSLYYHGKNIPLACSER